MSSLTALLNIRYPLIQSGMGGVAGPELAAEVSRAGGLGIVAGLNVPPADLREQIRRLRSLAAGAPFGVNLWLHPDLRPPIDPATLPARDIATVNAALNAARRAVALPESNALPGRSSGSVRWVGRPSEPTRPT
jgi:NAD(P)H-dependent flavin oxidoreductase YrpB (nitropropane dioxygenase family)